MLSRNSHHNTQHDERGSEPNTIVVGGHTCINVPMLSVAYMNSETGEWDRYRCVHGNKTARRDTGIVKTKANRQLATRGLVSCMDINFISRTGVIKTHIPPYICPTLSCYTGNSPLPGSKDKIDIAAFKIALKALLNTRESELGAFTVEVVVGSWTLPGNVVSVLSELFRVESFKGTSLSKMNGGTAVSGTTRVNLGTSPPTLFCEEVQRFVDVPKEDATDSSEKFALWRTCSCGPA